MNTKKDIESSDDIRLLVDSFYELARQDKLIGPIFNTLDDSAWKTHMPVMYAFWESVLLGTGKYSGNPILKHITLHKRHTLSEMHFDQWVNIWNTTVDKYFTGVKAKETKTKAKAMKELMLFKISKSEEEGFIQ